MPTSLLALTLLDRVPGIAFGLPLVLVAAVVFAATHHEDQQPSAGPRSNGSAGWVAFSAACSSWSGSSAGSCSSAVIDQGLAPPGRVAGAHATGRPLKTLLDICTVGSPPALNENETVPAAGIVAV